MTHIKSKFINRSIICVVQYTSASSKHMQILSNPSAAELCNIGMFLQLNNNFVMLYIGVKRNSFKRDVSVILPIWIKSRSCKNDKDTIPNMLYTMQKLLYITFSAIGKSIECNKTLSTKIIT